MLRLPPFKYLAPQSIKEAVKLKHQFGESAMYFAGGTDLFPNMKRRQYNTKILIGLRNLKELRKIDFEDGLKIGAGVTLSTLEENSEIRKNYPVLAKAAGLVSTPQLRNMGTIGGNLCLDTRCSYYNQNYQWRKSLGFCMKKDGKKCWVALSSPKCLAVSSSDCAPVIMALNGEIKLIGHEGERRITANDFYINDGITFLNKKPDELVVSLSLPPLKEGWIMNYEKLRRRDSIDFPILGIAIALRLKDSGECEEARIVIGAVASSPLRAYEAEKKIIGKKLSSDRIELAAKIVSKIAKPVENTDMSLFFRKKMVRQFVIKAIQDVLV